MRGFLRLSFGWLVLVVPLLVAAQADSRSAIPNSADSSAPRSVDLPTAPDPSTASALPSAADMPIESDSQCNTGQSANSQSSAAGSDQQTQRQKAQQEVEEQEKQRVEGIVPTFNVTYRHDAVPLTPGQKMNLSLHSAIDPFSFASAFLEAGYHEADNDLKGFPWGPKGYFERSGAAYLDTFDGDILSTGIVPSLFRQDPRYFRLGVGPVGHRVLYSLATNFIAKSDRSGHWQPNYGNLLGNFAAGELSNLYYPSGNSGFGLAASNTVIQIAEGAGGSIFNEFWPDISRRLLHKDPTHGLDAQAQAAYSAAKLPKQPASAQPTQ
jgi:hypothetical protein